MRKSKYEWIILDIDDTLLDYGAGSLNALTKCLNDTGHEFLIEYHQLFSEIDSRLWVEAQLGNLTPNQVVLKRFEELTVAIEVDVDPKQLATSYAEYLVRDTFFVPEVWEALDALLGNCNLVAATNGISRVQQARIENSGLRKYFSQVFISDEIGFTKPSHEFYLQLHSGLQYPERSSMLMVGDSLSSDIKGGNGFGIDTCWFNPGRMLNTTGVLPTHEISNLLQLVGIVRNGRQGT
jgi:2-haloacid dehalogenase